MHSNRAILLATLPMLVAGCATSEQLSTWRGHEAHFASVKHMAFSLRHASVEQETVSDMDRTSSRDEGWWGAFVPPEPGPPPSDISGQWRGVWRGVDPFDYPRTGAAAATFTQDRSGGKGWIRLDDALVSSIPAIIRSAGSVGVDVVYTVRGESVIVQDPAGSRTLRVEFKVVGEELVGHVVNSETPTSIVLTRLVPPPRPQ